MREKSQLEDMRAAVRGDLERARARREADPWRATEPERQPDPEPEPEVVPDPEPEPVAEIVEPPQEPDPTVETMEDLSEPPASESPPATEPAAPAKTSFLARLFARG